MSAEPLHTAIARVPAGAWAVGVSGGADSVALLGLLIEHRPDVRCHVAHLDHETRDGGSAADARFVADFCTSLNVPFTIRTRSQVASLDASGSARAVKNRSAHFRVLRHALFRAV